MKTKTHISAQDREFFELVSRAAFSNPFSDERIRLDLQIARCSPKLSADERVELVKQRIFKQVRQLEAEGKADVRLYGGDDFFSMQAVFLFEIFHYLLDHFDRLIPEQIKAGDRLCPVAFARDALAMLAKRGFSSDESHRYFAMFYQLRRAYYFIDHALIGVSPSMKQLRLHLWNNVFTHNIYWYERYLWDRMEDFSTLLLGETGTGKGTAAAAIGRSGFIPFDAQKGCFTESFTRNFVAINLSQYSESLIESELFGHKKGAFTGAIENHEGLFGRCSPHGSIFLDEIGDLSVPIQIKLLQILQERTFSPVGSHEKHRFSGRVIAATNKPLNELRYKNLFRDDFFYRLCSDIIVVPSLSQRLQEDPLELDHMLAHVVSRTIGEPSPELVEMIREVIRTDLGQNYAWPGNVRELEQAVRRILLTKHYQGDYKPVAPDLRDRLLSGISNGSMDAQEVLISYCALLYQRHGTYEEVSRRTRLDRRTVKKYVELWNSGARDSKE